MSELFDKEVNAQKGSLKKLPGFMQAPASPQKVCDENERNKKKQCSHKNVIDGRKPFIRHTQRTEENNLNELRINDSGHNEGTICLVNG